MIEENTPDMVDERAAAGGVQITYAGFCKEGTQGTDTESWRIMRYRAIISADATVTEKTLADGSVYFNKVWDARESYNYMFK
jgi:hypothetical protein